MRILGTTASHFTELPPVVSGGTRYTDATFVYRAFTSSGTLTISGSALSATVYAMGAGGGGAGSAYNPYTPDYENYYDAYHGGGGGAGGRLVTSSTSIPVGSNAVTVGAGGAGGLGGGFNARGNFGGNSNIPSASVFTQGGDGGFNSQDGYNYGGNNPTFAGGAGAALQSGVTFYFNGGGGAGAGGQGGNATSTTGGARGVSLSVPELTTPGYNVLGNGGCGFSYFFGFGAASGTNGILGNGGNAGVADGGGASGTNGLVVVRYLRSLTGE